VLSELSSLLSWVKEDDEVVVGDVDGLLLLLLLFLFAFIWASAPLGEIGDIILMSKAKEDDDDEEEGTDTSSLGLLFWYNFLRAAAYVIPSKDARSRISLCADA